MDLVGATTKGLVLSFFVVISPLLEGQYPYALLTMEKQMFCRNTNYGHFNGTIIRGA